MKPEETALKVIKENYDEKAGIFWTGGKDSTLMLHLIRSVYPRMRNPVILLDSGVEFPELYKFARDMVYRWDLNFKKFQYEAPDAHTARKNKIKALNEAIKELGLKKIFVAIRTDEHESRSKETYVSKRKDHTRIHPILDFTEDYLWKYIKRASIPYCELYKKGYRSLGEAPFTKPGGKTERGGRDAEKERIMKMLRMMGYF